MNNESLDTIYKIEDKIGYLKPYLDSVNYDNEEDMKIIKRISSEVVGDIIFSMRKTKEFNFFAILLDKIDVVLDPHLPAPAAVCFKRNHFELSYNPFLMFEFDKYFIRAFIIHELYHIIMNHLRRSTKYMESGNYSHSTINIGLDVSINQYIPELANDERFANIPLLAKMIKQHVESERECEYYIELLEKHPSNISPKKMMQMLDDALNEMKNKKKGNGSSSDSSGENESSSEQSSGNDSSEDSKPLGEDGSNSSSNSSGGDDSSENAQHRVVKRFNSENSLDRMIAKELGSSNIDEFVLKEMLKYASEKSRGTLPAGVAEMIEKLFEEPIIKWQNVLKNYLGRLPIPFKRTNTRLNRRLPERLDIMGKLPDAYFPIVCAFDTSGSVSNYEYQMCLNEVWSIITLQKKKFKLTVIECDMEINKVYEIKSKRDFQKMEARHGYGGTAFSPVYEYLRANKSKYKDAVVIYFTDGYGEAELTTKPLNHNNIWVITDSTSNLSIKHPYGRVLELRLNELEEKYNRKGRLNNGNNK